MAHAVGIGRIDAPVKASLPLAQPATEFWGMSENLLNTRDRLEFIKIAPEQTTDVFRTSSITSGLPYPMRSFGDQGLPCLGLFVRQKIRQRSILTGHVMPRPTRVGKQNVLFPMSKP